MFDLHIHSNCSDGYDRPNEVLQKAERLGLKAISITDHDNCNAYNSFDSKLFSGKIVTGIEMQAYCKGLSIELLGYGFDIKKMQGFLQSLYQPFEYVNKEELRRLYERCVSLGMRFYPAAVENYNSQKYFYATTYLHSEMQKFPENKALVPDEGSWEHEHIFFKRHTTNPNSVFYIDMNDLIPSVEKVVGIIHNCGGRVFVPHIYQYEENAEMLLHCLVNEYAVDGVECYYPSFTQEQTDYLLDFCSKHNLLISGGSDYHGGNRQNPMGMNFDPKSPDCGALHWLI